MQVGAIVQWKDRRGWHNVVVEEVNVKEQKVKIGYDNWCRTDSDELKRSELTREGRLGVRLVSIVALAGAKVEKL